MTESDHDDLDAVEAELRGAFDLLEPVPPHLTVAAIEAFSWRDVNAERAELIFDSLADTGAGVRGDERPRLLSFEHPNVIIEAEVDGSGRTRRISGRITPPAAVEVSIRHGGEPVTVMADELGRFSAGEIRAGRIRLIVRIPGRTRPVATGWFAD